MATPSTLDSDPSRMPRHPTRGHRHRRGTRPHRRHSPQRWRYLRQCPLGQNPRTRHPLRNRFQHRPQNRLLLRSTRQPQTLRLTRQGPLGARPLLLQRRLLDLRRTSRRQRSDRRRPRRNRDRNGQTQRQPQLGTREVHPRRCLHLDPHDDRKRAHMGPRHRRSAKIHPRPRR